MRRTLAMRAATLAFAALLTAIPIMTPPVFADEAVAPASLVAGAIYEGVWKTDDNAAPDLDSRITLGVRASGGTLVFLLEDGKLLIQYATRQGEGFLTNPVFATPTPEGFKIGAFDPSRNSSESVFTVADDGATLIGDRKAMFNGKVYTNHTKMTLVSPGDGG